MAELIQLIEALTALAWLSIPCFILWVCYRVGRLFEEGFEKVVDKIIEQKMREEETKRDAARAH